MSRAPFPSVSLAELRAHPDLSKIIPPSPDAERNPERLSLAELLERDGALAAPVARRAEALRKEKQ